MARYWVGGTASWDGTAGTKWATTSGGAGGASVPTTADDVFFDAASTGTCTISSGNTGAKSINCTGFTGTITGNAGITVAGSITLDAGMTFTHTGLKTITGTGTLTTAGKFFGLLSIDGAGITVTLGDAISLQTNANMDIRQGTFDTAGYNFTGGRFRLGETTSVRGLNLNSSTVTLNAQGGFSAQNTTNLTFNAGTSQINSTSSTDGIGVNGGLTFYNVSFTSTSGGTRTITGTNTFNNLTLNASATRATALAISNDQTVNGTFTCAGSSATQRGFVRSNSIGTTRTITANAISADDCDFRDITIAGTAAGASPTRAGDCGNNSGITFPAAKTVYRVGTNTSWAGSSSWATTSGGSGSNDNFPLAQDTAVIDNSTTLTGTLDFSGAEFNLMYNIGSLDCSNRTTGITLSFGVGATSIYNFYGSFTLGSGVTISGTSTQTFSGRGTQTFTSAGKTITFPITVDKPAGAFELGDAFVSSNTITHTRGTFDAKNYNLTCTRFLSNNSNTRTITMGSGLWTLSGTGAVWDTTTGTGLTLNIDTANILLSDTSSTARSFNGGSQTYNKLTIGGATGTSTLTIQNNNTFSELASTKTVAHTITFSGSQTIGTWSVTGTSGNVVTLNSSGAGASRTLTKSGGGFLTGIDYLDVRDIVGSPISDTWYIGANSVYNTTAPNTARGLFLTQRANNAVIVLEDTSGSGTWTVPSDWNDSNNSIHLIGGGGGGAGSIAEGSGALRKAGGGGGGGGGYTRLDNQTLTIGASINYQAGTAGGGGGSTANGTAGGTTSWNAGASTAGGGSGGQVSFTPSSTGGTGGTGSTYNGGNGGAGSTGTGSLAMGGGGGGGAGGPNGAGANGGDGFGSATNANAAGGGGGGNGGGSNGGNGTSNTGGAGGNNSASAGGGGSNTGGAVGGGGGGGTNNSSGLTLSGGNGIDIFGIGGGGGSGGGNSQSPTIIGGFYGGGGGGAGSFTSAGRSGGAGRQGAIIITYVPAGAVTATGNMFFMFN